MPYSHETDGPLEKTNQTTAKILSKILQNKEGEWPGALLDAHLAIQTTDCTATGFAPIEVLSDRKVITPNYAEKNGEPAADVEWLNKQGFKEQRNIQETTAADAGCETAMGAFSQISSKGNLYWETGPLG